MANKSEAVKPALLKIKDRKSTYWKKEIRETRSLLWYYFKFSTNEAMNDNGALANFRKLTTLLLTETE
ncbi:MAG: hypothetical protein K9G46_03960 [Flavobacteriales bacterium]|nr:hypothetical protein [Flavobacteriales bacterium]